MSSRSTLIGVMVVIVVILVGGGIWALTKKNDSSKPIGEDFNPPVVSPTIAVDITEVSMVSTGFEPSTIQIKKGANLCFVNADSEAHWPASNNHPTHLVYPEFDPKQPVAAGDKWCFTFDKVGSWGFHDHLNPSVLGTITVKE